MRAYYKYSSRSDKVLAEHLKQIELVPYEEAEIVLCIGDRKEIFELAYKAFIDHKYIIHYYAGIKNKYPTTYDCYLRHCITIMSNEQWVENKKCARFVKKLCKVLNLTPNIKVVGSNHLLDVVLDYSKVPDEPYNLVLYNPCTKIKEIFIGPNPDESYASLSQEEYLALASEAKEIRCNSSSGVYELPFLVGRNGNKPKIIWLGKRNKGRKYK